jgi:hypothetical protein
MEVFNIAIHSRICARVSSLASAVAVFTQLQQHADLGARKQFRKPESFSLGGRSFVHHASRRPASLS